MRETDQGVHDSELPGMIQLEAGDAFCRWATSPVEDKVVAILDLGEEQSVLTARLPALGRGEERSEPTQPLVSASSQIAAGERICQLLQALGMLAVEESVGMLLKLDWFLPQTVGQPIMLVEVDASRKREVRANPHEQASPMAVIDGEVVLGDPALPDLKVPAVFAGVSDGHHDAGGFACLEDHHYLVGRGLPEVRRYELVTRAPGSVHDRGTPSLGAVLYPIAKLRGDVAQNIAADRVLRAIGTEEANYPFGLLEGLNDRVEEDAVEDR